MLALYLAVTATLLTPQTPTPQAPQTTPERTNARATSTNAEVDTFIEQLLEHDARNDHHRIATHPFGHTTLGRELRCVVASRTPRRAPAEFRSGDRLRALILANIHGGEVEGKEATQVLLREIVHGEHDDLLERVDFLFVPVFNADGNDAIDPRNRVSQNGPEAGVGRRHNAQDLDLNRDYVKAESPEVRAQLGLFRAFDPHLYMDLHTTNGSAHGYQLTYAPSLSTNLDPELDAFSHDEFMPAIRRAMSDRHGMRTFDYGNFPDRRRGDSGPGWYTFDHKPRLGWNYAGLRNRLSVLSEAYSYVPFDERIAVTRAFVLETVRALVAMEDRARGVFTRADARVTRRGAPRPLLGFDSALSEPREEDLLVTELEPVETPHGDRYVADPNPTTRPDVPVHVRFEARRSIVYPRAWVVVGASDLVRQTLLLHGIHVERLSAPVEAETECFWPTSIAKPRMRFQGHRLVRIRGELTTATRTLPAGALVVPARQRLARVAAMLLDPHSEDSLATWNFFDESTRKVDEVDLSARLVFPVVRVHDLPDWETRPVTLETEHIVNPHAFTAHDPARAAHAVEVRCLRPGWPLEEGFGTTTWRDRIIEYRIGDTAARDVEAVRDMLRALPRDAGDAIVLRPDRHVTESELLALAKLARAAGFTDIQLDVAKRE